MADLARFTVPDIETERLCLRWMSPAFLNASLAGQRGDADALLGVALPPGWPPADVRRRMKMRLAQMKEAPDAAPWLLRAVLRREDGELGGVINFHGPPQDGHAELGYGVFEAQRRRGYASEAALAMMRWARDNHGVKTFVVSISPSNRPSLAMAAKLGFRQTGVQIDEEDGEEWVFELAAASVGEAGAQGQS